MAAEAAAAGEEALPALPASLLGLGVCAACTLRVVGCRSPDRYLAVVGGAVAGGEPEEASAGEPSACGLCLGLLEGFGGSRARLREQLRGAGYEDAGTYTLGIELPVLCVFRHHVLLSHLRDAAPELVSGCVELKDALRWLLCAALSEQGLEPSGSVNEDAPAVTVDVVCACAHPAASRELACLDALGGSRRRPARESRKKRRRTGGAATKQTAEEDPEAPPPATSTASSNAVVEALGDVGAAECLEMLGPGPASLPERLRRLPGVGGEAAATRVTLGREPLYIRGRYVKLSRSLPQSPWFIDGERKGEGSVEECICGPVTRALGATECKFHAEGREDIDVRMLGAGRTFVVEAKNVRRAAADLAALEAAVSAESGGVVRVRTLEWCAAAAMASLQRDAEEHRKTYVCMCWCPTPLEERDLEPLRTRDVQMMQKTPVRVLHRRAPVVRPRMVYWTEPQWINRHYFKLRVNTQAGAYIKEFVHGDLGRTRPSVRDLLQGRRIEITALDVEGVEEGPAEAAPGGAAER